MEGFWDIFSTITIMAVSISDPLSKSNFLCSSWVIPFQQNPQHSFREMLFLPEAGNFKLVKALFWAKKSYSREILIKNRCKAGWLAEKEPQCSLYNPWGKDMFSMWGKENKHWVECDMVSLQGAREPWLPPQLALRSANISLQVCLSWVAIQPALPTKE